MSQDGRLLARATIDVPGLGPIGPDRLRAIATSAGAQRIWITIAGRVPGFPGREAALLEIPAFDEHDASAAMPETKKGCHRRHSSRGSLKPVVSDRFHASDGPRSPVQRNVLRGLTPASVVWLENRGLAISGIAGTMSTGRTNSGSEIACVRVTLNCRPPGKAAQPTL